MINFRKLLPFLLYSCKRVSEIISKDKSERSLKERFILSYHEFICKACHNYQIQNDVMERSFFNSKAKTIIGTLSSQKKSEIIKLLEKEAS